MNVIAKRFLFASLLGVAAFSTANAAYFPHAFDGRAREVRFERGERFGREHFEYQHFDHGRFGREFRSGGRFDSHRDFRRLEVGRAVHELPFREFHASGFGLKR